MAQQAFNSTENINIAHNVSMWFQRDFVGTFIEMGDLLVDGVNLAPEFNDFRSYRNGINALRKKLLTSRAASITATLNEPNIVNLERVLFGSVPVSGDAVTAFEGKHLTVKAGTGGLVVVDLADAGESDFSAITVKSIYDADDVLEATNLIAGDILPDTDGLVAFDETDTGLNIGDIVYVRYEIAVTTLFSTEIYGADTTAIEGACRLQARNLSGGVVQIWELASVSLAPNGDLTYPLDAIQTVPITATLQERSGTFGKVYTK